MRCTVASPLLPDRRHRTDHDLTEGTLSRTFPACLWQRSGATCHKQNEKGLAYIDEQPFAVRSQGDRLEPKNIFAKSGVEAALCPGVLGFQSQASSLLCAAGNTCCQSAAGATCTVASNAAKALPAGLARKRCFHKICLLNGLLRIL